jgi:hypothetical protein
MKKMRIILFVILYAVFNAGMAVDFHFCYKSFHHLTVLVQPENCCDGGCCHNSTYELKIKPVPAELIIHDCLGFSHWQRLPRDPIIPAIDTGLLHKNPIYLSNRVLLI